MSFVKNVFKLYLTALVSIVITACGGGSSTAPAYTTAAFYASMLTSLASKNSSSDYTVVQGNVYLFENSSCATFVPIFNSCFGNNAAAPYIIPQPPIEQSYVDPSWNSLNTPGPNGVSTNIVYRLSDADALVTIVNYPPTGAYFGYLSYVFTRPISNYPIANPLQVMSPDPSRYEIFGSVGNTVNNIVVQNQYGPPWNGNVIMFITTSNQALADDITTRMVAKGIDPRSIFVEKLGTNVNTGNDRAADDLVTLMRYAIPKDSSAADTWHTNIASNVLVYKVTNPLSTVTRYPANQYTSRSGNDELLLAPALNELANLLKTWYATNSPSLAASISMADFIRSSIDVTGIPTNGLVGSNCINKGIICAGDSQDTSTYAISKNVLLSSTSSVFVAGVDHNQTGNSSYYSISIYNAAIQAGVQSASQSNASAVGFNSGNLTGSAEVVLRELGIYDSASTVLKLALPNLYVAVVSKDCTIATQTGHCISLMGDTLIPAGVAINMYERSYLRPGDTTAANNNIMVYPKMIGPGIQ